MLGFPGNTILEISSKIRSYVGSPYVRGRINMKVRLIAILSPVIFEYF